MSTTQVGAPSMVPSMRQAGPPERAVVEASIWADLPEIVGRWVWMYRWPLTPAVGVGGVLACGLSAPGSLVAVLLAGAGLMELWRRKDVRIAGRPWLSKAEKGYAVEWLTAAGVWSILAAVVVSRFPARPVVLLLVGLLFVGTGRSSWRWAASRMPKRAKLSAEAQRLLKNWAPSVAVWGPDPIKGSKVIRHTAVEPAPGAVSFSVRLRPGIHPKECASDAVTNSIERLLSLPVGTTHLSIDRSSSERLQVNLAPKRHLETAPVDWPGPVWEKGRIVAAGALDGSQVKPRLSDEDGVFHCLVAGTSGSGKSRALRVLVLAEPANGLGVLVLVDGGGGTSCPELEPAAKIYARTPEEWVAAIHATYNAYLSRRSRRGLAKLTRFVAGKDEPTLTLAIDEAGHVSKVIGQREHDMVLEMLQQGRKLGVRVIQCVQDPMADEIIGGRKARALLGGAGLVIALRAGDGMSSRLALSSTAVPIDLTELPQAPGSCFITERGQVLTGNPVRFVDAHEEAAGAVAQRVEVIDLDPDDEDELWATWEAELAEEFTAEEIVDEVRETDAAILSILAGGAKRLGEIAPKTGKSGDEGWHPEWVWSRVTASTALMRLLGQERVVKDGDVWSLATERVGAEQ